MKRIMIIGWSGSGKSHLARALHNLTGLSLIHLDQFYWLPECVEQEMEKWVSKVQRLCQEETWIMDGNCGSTMDVRISRADTIIFLDIPTFTCVWHALKRTLNDRGQTKPDMTRECPERFDWKFTHYILSYRNKIRPVVLSKLAKVEATKKVYIPKNLREINLLIT